MRRLKQLLVLSASLVACGAITVGAGVSALEYQSETIPLTFQFDTTMTVTMSGSSLSITDLMPNTSQTSDALDITVVTNDNSGYTMKATVGNASNASTDLVATNGSFAMIGSAGSLSTGEWGYTTNGGTSFGVLPLYTSTPATVNSSSVPTDSTSGKTSFQIGAYATPSQAAGNYSNVINFTVVANSVMTGGYYMQDVTVSTMATMLPNVGDTVTLYDKRDSRAYTVAKLADNKYWMVDNLNLAGGTKLDSAGSNVPAGYTQSEPYYTLPDSTAISSGTSVPSDQFSDDAGEYVFNTGNNTTTCNSSTPCNSYYSWLVATAGGKNSSGTSVTDDGYNAAYSICPKGWRLPTSTTSNANAQSSNNWKTGDFYALAMAYGADLSSQYYQSSGTFYNNAGPGTTPNFLLAGGYYVGSFSNGGSVGYYWSSTSESSTGAYILYFNSGVVYSANNYYRRNGLSVRCLFAE
ncbi:hypothetical protein IJJ37_01845 [Candidatus Saccharibacteria bacterium]|nr:hypothetical protein [Candidatus Saccharibacteria bacterium]